MATFLNEAFGWDKSEMNGEQKGIIKRPEIFKNSHFEEHLHTDTSEVSLGSDYLELSFCTVTFKTIMTKIPVAFKPED